MTVRVSLQSSALLLFCIFSCSSARTQSVPAPAPSSQPEIGPQLQVAPYGPPSRGDSPPFRTMLCPGGFATNLTVLNCRYTRQLRLKQFVTSSFTDEAMLQSIFGALGSQVLGTPSEWPRTWNFYGQRLGARYTASIGRGTAELIVGAIAHDDPRHISCADDAGNLLRRVRH